MTRTLPQEECEAFAPISLLEMDGVSLLNRVDTKYIVPRAELASLLAQLKDNYRIFFHLGQRIHAYQTLYFDTQDHAMYLRHHNGFATRLKVRKRWYLGADLAFFEVKRRTNRSRTIKKRMRLLPDRDVGTPHGANASPDSKEMVWLRANCPFEMTTLVPQTWTHFDRITLVDLALQERVTIDHNLRFCHAVHDPHGDAISTPLDTALDWKSPAIDCCIVEVKRGGARNRSVVMDALRARHILPASFSKYCIGTALLQPQIKHNRFKPMLRSLGGLHL